MRLLGRRSYQLCRISLCRTGIIGVISRDDKITHKSVVIFLIGIAKVVSEKGQREEKAKLTEPSSYGVVAGCMPRHERLRQDLMVFPRHKSIDR